MKCAFHPDREAKARCVKCNKALCDECAIPAKDAAGAPPLRPHRKSRKAPSSVWMKEMNINWHKKQREKENYITNTLPSDFCPCSYCS